MKPNAVEAALRVAAGHFGVSVADIRSQRRTQTVHPARLWGAYLAAQTSGASVADIGAALDGRDETIISMYVRARGRNVDTDEESARLFDLLKRRLRELR